MYHLLQEGIVDDITSVGKLIIAARDGFNQGRTDTMADGTNKNSLRTYSYSSAARAASNLICVFPVLASRTVSAETTQMVSKYVEQKGCIILQMALQAANISNAKNGMDYIRNFHQNLNIGGDGIDALSKTLNAWIDGLDDSRLNQERANDSERAHAYRESVSMNLYNKNKEVDDSAVYESDEWLTISPAQMKSLMEMFSDAEKYQIYDTKLNPISINDFEVNESAGDYHVSIRRINLDESKGPSASQQRRDQMQKEADAAEARRDAANKAADEAERRAANAKANGDKYADDARRAKEKADRYKSLADSNKDRMNRYKDQEQAAKTAASQAKKGYERQQVKNDREDIEWDQKQEKYRRDQREHEEDRRNQMADREREARERENQQTSKVRSTSFQLMKDQDIKKMNNAVPSLLVVRFYSDSKATVSTEFIIGVKSKVVGCNSDEILRRIANDNKDGHFMTNLLRTMSGELKKSDFLFGISRTSEDLQAIKKKGSQGDTWALLQSRAIAAKQAVRQGRVNDFSAITTVLVSQADCDELYKEENIDLTVPAVAQHFMQSYNLLGLIIADDATESLKMIYDDGDNYFEELSYMMLERETDNGTYKKLINLIARSR